MKSSRASSAVDSQLLNFCKSSQKQDLNNKFSFHSVDESVVREALLQIKSAATGSDNININMLFLCLNRILPFITNIVNSCLLDSVFPECWKISRIMPIPKEKDATSFNDLRPISILPVLSKVVEKIMYNQIVLYVSENSLLPEIQSGFRAGYSCSTALLKVTDDIISAADEGKVTALVLLDFTKAFERIDHSLLLAILKFMGFTHEAVTLIRNYLSTRFKFVETTNGRSNLEYVSHGVPQGSILGPLLFSIYTSNLSSCLEHSAVHLYADDTQLYLSFPPTEVVHAQILLNEDVNRLISFSNKHCLHINAAKTQILLFGKGKDFISSTFQLQIGNATVTCSKSVKKFGS